MIAPDGVLAAPAVHEGWEFAGWGQSERITDLDTTVPLERLDQGHKHTLGKWSSTAICGNDITSSVLYVSALCIGAAGVLAPVALLVVAGVLFLFRKVYAEVGGALPLNGGTYTLLLNTTNKKVAAAAAALTLLSYIATAVISAGDAMHYAHNLFGGLNIFWATVGLLGFFAFLNLIGISESAKVALAIFIFHIVTLTILAVAAGIYVAMHPEQLGQNFQVPSSEGFLHALFFGFAAAMLGISGFESSANFIEEQKPGVFPLTLRNMWIAVAIFNPLMAFLALGSLPLGEFHDGGPTDLLAQMGDISVGGFFKTWISIDAVLVLSGAVLTSYVGVTGLVRRMALDRCLPRVLLAKNKIRDTNHWIILGFFALCCSILVSTSGDVEVLAGVYTISFLCVMSLFAIGNMLLKKKRSRLPTTVRASWLGVTVALAAVLAGLIGNIVKDPKYVEVFGIYFVAAILVIAVMFLRIDLMKLLLFVSTSVLEKVRAVNSWVNSRVRRKIDEINSLTVVYFTKGDSLPMLNRAALYVLQNEHTTRLKVVHVYEDEAGIPAELAEHLSTIDHLYPQLRIDFVAVRGTFGPDIIESLSQRLDVPKNYMFIATPGDRFPHSIDDLGGVRLIL
ncbi:MAG: APC family permease [Deltaproteobacteria bacterium]|nr:APC family permease [Deltaproteobacteria bacterium]